MVIVTAGWDNELDQDRMTMWEGKTPVTSEGSRDQLTRQFQPTNTDPLSDLNQVYCFFFCYPSFIV
jgi:hypothetical protein